ncbi:MAG: fatty acid hydroxylase family protein [Bacteroidetes bacterium]|nr:MAG: fatty acid hydroxylase family protein [Bacteroidota bacterium]TAF92012.1 MAG: fatty acid hydroxylase family protein [Bacteroidota bacterium]
MELLKTFGLFYAVVFLRYAIVAFVAWQVFYKWKLHAWLYRKIQQKLPTSADVRRELAYSAITSVLFAVVGILFLWQKGPLHPYTQMYADSNAYGWPYFLAALGVMLIVHDTYFYWMHRLMHHPALFKKFHVLHHKSTNPSPWAAFAFQPSEALVEAGIVPLLACLLPLHVHHFLVFFLIMIVYNVYGHLGWELYPKKLLKHPVGKWLNTSVSHNQHHQYFKGNYGLYFTYWDVWMGTLRKDYTARYTAVTEAKKEG